MQHSTQIARIAARTLLRTRSLRFGCFLSADGEVDTQPLIARALSRRSQIWLPCLGQPKLRFRRYAEGMQLRTGDFGILEPTCGEVRRAADLDVIFMPLVAFDASGNRLGMGGGYYDRSLASLRHHSCYKRPRLIGIAFQLQQVPELQSCRWDIPLDGVLTEAGLRNFDR